MRNFQITDMPPGLFDMNDAIDDDHANLESDETAKEGNKEIKTQKFYTVVKQSDIQMIVEQLKKKAEYQKLMNKTLIQLPEAEANETWKCSKYFSNNRIGNRIEVYSQNQYLFILLNIRSMPVESTSTKIWLVCWARNKVLKFYNGSQWGFILPYLLQWVIMIYSFEINTDLGIDPSSTPTLVVWFVSPSVLLIISSLQYILDMWTMWSFCIMFARHLLNVWIYM